MKLRGRREDIMRFLDNEIIANSAGGDISEYINKEVEEDGAVSYAFHNDPYVNGTRRMFLKDNEIYLEDEDARVCIDVRQAWSFTPREGCDDEQIWVDFSEKYNLDIKLFGIESGFCFTQELIVLRGKRAINNVKEYKDWFWDCPFPRMGG